MKATTSEYIKNLKEEIREYQNAKDKELYKGNCDLELVQHHEYKLAELYKELEYAETNNL